jgi:hypothetical protein
LGKHSQNNDFNPLWEGGLTFKNSIRKPGSQEERKPGIEKGK